MPSRPVARVLAAVVLAALVSGPAHGQSAPPPAAPVTTVMAMLKLTPGSTRDQVMKVMPDEVRDTVQLYLDGKITHWYSRADASGVVFLIDAASVDEAKATTDALPLVKAGLASFDFIALTPLNPLRALIARPSAK